MNMRIQRFTGGYMGEHENTGVYRRIHGFTHKYEGLQEYTWVNTRIRGFTGVYMGEHENTGLYRSIHG